MAPRNPSRASTAAGRRRANARAGARATAHPRSRAAPKPRSGRRAASTPPKRRAPKRPASRSRRPHRRRAAARESHGFSWPQRLILLACAAAILAGGYFLWLRDSSLVAVSDVEVVGVSTDREAIVAELTTVGERMTTLHVDAAAIEEAAAAFPTVKSVAVDPNFPHGLRIEVTERPPAVIVRSDGEETAAAADGTLLTGVPVPDEALPAIEVDQLPGGARLSGEALEEAIVAGAAPEPLRPLIENVVSTRDRGVEVTLRGDIPVLFGDSVDAGAKWEAAAAVLADPDLDYARYVDVRVPTRPSVGQDGPVTSSAGTDPPA